MTDFASVSPKGHGLLGCTRLLALVGLASHVVPSFSHEFLTWLLKVASLELQKCLFSFILTRILVFPINRNAKIQARFYCGASAPAEGSENKYQAPCSPHEVGAVVSYRDEGRGGSRGQAGKGGFGGLFFALDSDLAVGLFGLFVPCPKFVTTVQICAVTCGPIFLVFCSSGEVCPGTALKQRPQVPAHLRTRLSGLVSEFSA